MNKTLKNLRVVVHIDKQDPDNENGHTDIVSPKHRGNVCVKRTIKRRVIDPSLPKTSYENPEFDNKRAEILLIDDKSVQLNLISTEDDDIPYTNICHKMYFDRASYSNADSIKYEIALVMDVLLLERKNFCIMHFGIKQVMNTNLFYDLLITLFNKRLCHYKYKLQFVKLECLEIAASLQKSKISCSEKGFAMRANLSRHDDYSKDNKSIIKTPKYVEKQFHSTRGLLLWLVNEYRFKFADNNGHEKLQLSFSIADQHQNLFQVQLSLFNIFLNLMHTDDRSHWHHYMDHIGEGCRCIECNFVHSGLTLRLSNYIEGTASDNTLLLFDIPTNIKMAADTTEMLQMAQSVIKNRKREILLLSDDVRNETLKDYNRCFSPQICEKLGKFCQKDRRPALPLFLKRHSIGATIYDANYSGQDFNNLICWYRKIDECVENNRQLREKYFNRYFKFKTNQILSIIENIFQSLESLHFHTNEEIDDHEQIELNKLFESYAYVRLQFQKISEDIKNTNFEEILKVYLETKAFDLNKQAKFSIEKLLQESQENCNFTFDNLRSKIRTLNF